MKLLLLGAPGAGKGTQANFLCDYFKIPKISTGDMLREAINEKNIIGIEVQKMMMKGNLVSDDLIIKLVNQRIKKDDCKKGFLFDGFPRTINQAKSLIDTNINLDFIIEIYVSDDIVLERLSGRRVHKQSGRTYHIKYNPPKIKDKDDISGEDLVIRDDDKENIIKKRLKVYHEETELLVDFYLNLYKKNGTPVYIKINGNNNVEIIKKELLSIIIKNLKI